MRPSSARDIKCHTEMARKPRPVCAPSLALDNELEHYYVRDVHWQCKPLAETNGVAIARIQVAVDETL